MVTDPANGMSMSFGGWSGTGYLGDTWIWNGATWTQVVAAGPVARSNAAMTFDELRGVAVLFGGVKGVGLTGTLGDTWEWSLVGGWVQRAAAVHPAVRFGHAMAYDRNRGRTVLFGGRTVSGTVFLDDTWEWDGTAWTYFTPAVKPTRRMNHTMAFDPVSGRVLLFGGIQLGGPVVGDTWAWDGAGWTQLAPATPPAARQQAAMAEDTVRGRVVLFGGQNGGALSDTLEWDGFDWSIAAAPLAPAGAVLPAMARGPLGRHVVLFGGQTGAGVTLAETWWFGHVPAVVPFGAGCGVPPVALDAANGSAPYVGQDFVTEIAPVPPGAICFQSIGGSSQWAGTTPLPIDLTPLGMTGCTLYHDLAIPGLPCVVTGTVAQNTLAVPALPFLAGITLYMQCYMIAPGANPASVLTTNAIAMTFGI